jgi:hypothetical protein
MPKPVTVSIEVPRPQEEVFDFLDVMANHELFTDHLLHDWELSGPASGMGSKARVHTRVMGMSDFIEFEVVDAARPSRIAERNVSERTGRTAEGTYTLEPTASGGTRIAFEYRWITAPLADRLAAPLVRSFVGRSNETSMRRLAEQLSAAHAR